MITWWMKLGENLPPGLDALLSSIDGKNTTPRTNKKGPL